MDGMVRDKGSSILLYPGITAKPGHYSSVISPQARCAAVTPRDILRTPAVRDSSTGLFL
jgi:hypothetical protein